MGDYDDYSYDSFSTNPSTGLLMYDDSGIDIGGNPLGMSSYDAYSSVDTLIGGYDDEKHNHFRNNDEIYRSIENESYNNQEIESYNNEFYHSNPTYHQINNAGISRFEENDVCDEGYQIGSILLIVCLIASLCFLAFTIIKTFL